MKEIDLSEAMDIACTAVLTAGKEVLRIRKEGSLNTTQKSPEESDIVTAADFASEKILVRDISARFPDHGIRSEEGTTHTHGSDYEWIFDPVDGTKNFSLNKPFSVSAGLTHKGKPVLGVLYFPDDKVLISAIKDQGGRMNDVSVSRRDVVPLSQARVGVDVSSGGDAHTELTLYAKSLEGFVASIDRPRCSTFAARQIITGNLDCYVCGGGLTPYDLGAMLIILQEAGCIAEGLYEPIDLGKKKIPFIAATDRKLTEAIRAKFNI